ncbi:sugar ABC transporter ATP-binding protein [Mongoliimonas terrestris]|uniref:sugar ABC transporter ATP-binding protein n=1 Tax=Mongoliimonas terrestris TaxID=1709001 RepID=UPI00094968D2|nr:sugar ABC transporter ATP-binding protein [Mongoliimonas terrestris]
MTDSHPARTPPLLEVAGLTKSFFGVRVLHGIGYSLRAGEALGLVGENGSGKSTTMNILGGVHQPDGGAMLLDSAPYAPAGPGEAIRAGIAFIHQELNLFPNLTIEENLFIDGFPRRSRLIPLIDRAAIRRRTEDLLAQVNLDLKPGTPVARLSQGERQLVEIAKALGRSPKVIIFDEPTTSLTRREVDRLFAIIARLKARGIGIIYISHALEDVMTVCDHVTVLRDGALAGGGRRQDLSVPAIIAMMVGRSIDTVFPPRTVRPRAEEALVVEDLSQPGVAEAISFSIRAGEVLGLAGLMGSGRSELARMIFGLDRFARGRISVAGRPLENPTPITAMEAGIAFLTEDRRSEGLLMGFSVAENMVLTSLPAVAGALGLVDGRKVVDTAVSMARTVHLSTEKVSDTLVKHLSGGNQQKVVIGKWLLRQPAVFILDEPTRGIDVGAKQEVYRIINQLVERGSAVLLISSEIEELIGLSDRILTLCRGELTGGFERSPGPGPGFDREAIMTAATGVAVARTRTGTRDVA